MYTLDPPTIVETLSFSSIAMILLFFKGQDGLARNYTCACGLCTCGKQDIWLKARKKTMKYSKARTRKIENQTVTFWHGSVSLRLEDGGK